VSSSKYGQEQSLRSNISNAHNESAFQAQHGVPKNGENQVEQDPYPLAEHKNDRLSTKHRHNPKPSSVAAWEDGVRDVRFDNEIADAELRDHQDCFNPVSRSREAPNLLHDLHPAPQNPEKGANRTLLFQHPAIPTLDFQPRPKSRHSNHGRSMIRPLTPGTLNPQEPSRRGIHHSPNPSKVSKSRTQSNRTEIKSLVAKIAGNPPRSAQSPLNRDRALAILQEYFQEQDATLKIREAEVEELNNENAAAYESIRSLEKMIEEQREQSELLSHSLSHLKEQSSRYKQHANDVSKAQRFVKTEAAKLKETQQALALEAKIQTERAKEMVDRIKQAQASVEELQAGVYISMLVPM